MTHERGIEKPEKAIRRQTHSYTEPPESAEPELLLRSSQTAPLSHNDILALHHLWGNQKVMRMLEARTGRLLPKRTVQRQGDPATSQTVTMDPLQVTGDRGGSVENNVSNLDRLRGQGANPNEPQLGRGEEDVTRNAPNPTDPLPYTRDGWDGNTIMTRLGQYDRLAGTDSDTHRCVQAVAMASHIPAGPDAVASYLGSITFDGLLMRQIGERQRTAMQVIKLVKDRLRARTGTYGDLSWAQEAVHDFFYNDFEGTPEAEIQQQISPTLDSLNRNVNSMNVWCNTPAEVMAQTSSLTTGAQLVVNAWTVVFNSAFDQVEEQGFRTSDRMQVRINNRMVWIRRIRTDHRPRPQDISFPSDSKSGHQLLILKDNDAAGTLRLYEPEITTSGQHLVTLSRGGTELQQYMTDDPQNGIYGYIQITGQIVPNPVTSAFGTATP